MSMHCLDNWANFISFIYLQISNNRRRRKDYNIKDMKKFAGEVEFEKCSIEKNNGKLHLPISTFQLWIIYISRKFIPEFIFSMKFIEPIIYLTCLIQLELTSLIWTLYECLAKRLLQSLFIFIITWWLFLLHTIQLKRAKWNGQFCCCAHSAVTSGPIQSTLISAVAEVRCAL